MKKDEIDYWRMIYHAVDKVRTPKDNERTRAWRRHQVQNHMWRRLKQDRNEHYRNLSCPCWHDSKAMARFKEQPQRCSGRCCGNQRKYEGPRMSERRAMEMGWENSNG